MKVKLLILGIHGCGLALSSDIADEEETDGATAYNACFIGSTVVIYSLSGLPPPANTQWRVCETSRLGHETPCTEPATANIKMKIRTYILGIRGS